MTRRKRKNTELAYSMKPLEYYDGNDRVENKPVACNNTKKDNLEKNQIELLFDENEYLTKKLSDGLAKILGNSKIDTVNVKIDTVNIYLEQKRKYTRRKSTTSKKRKTTVKEKQNLTKSIESYIKKDEKNDEIQELYKKNENKLMKNILNEKVSPLVKTDEKTYGQCKTSGVNYNSLYEKILRSYSAKKDIYNPDLEIVLIANALDESDNILRESIIYGRERGYTNREMMPIAAAYGLKKYIYEKGIPEEECKLIGYDKKELEKYIVNTGSEGKNYNSFLKIVSYMQK